MIDLSEPFGSITFADLYKVRHTRLIISTGSAPTPFVGEAGVQHQAQACWWLDSQHRAQSLRSRGLLLSFGDCQNCWYARVLVHVFAQRTFEARRVHTVESKPHVETACEQNHTLLTEVCLAMSVFEANMHGSSCIKAAVA